MSSNCFLYLYLCWVLRAEYETNRVKIKFMYSLHKFPSFFFEGPYYPARRLFCNLTASCVQNCDLELIEVTFKSTIIG